MPAGDDGTDHLGRRSTILGRAQVGINPIIGLISSPILSTFVMLAIFAQLKLSRVIHLSTSFWDPTSPPVL
jgi:hypothetical protein